MFKEGLINSSSRRRPGSSTLNLLDSGRRRNDERRINQGFLKSTRWIIFLSGLIYAMPAPALLLDCKQNKDGTYLCVEIEGSRAITPAKSTVPEIDAAHIEQARKECIYREPRTRPRSGSAVRSEARKSAQQDYDRCVADRAWELKNLEQRSDSDQKN